MTLKCLSALATVDVPDLDCAVPGSGGNLVVVYLDSVDRSIVTIERHEETVRRKKLDLLFSYGFFQLLEGIICLLDNVGWVPCTTFWSDKWVIFVSWD